MYQFNVLYNHHIQARVIHPHQGEFIVEVSASETHMSQTFWKTVTSCHSLCIPIVLLVTNMHICTRLYAARRNSIIVSDTALTLPFSIRAPSFLFPRKCVPLGHPARHEKHNCAKVLSTVDCIQKASFCTSTR